MKSILYTFLFLIFASTFSLAQSIPNGGFENWSMETTYETLPPYETINLQTYLAGGIVGVTQVDGVSGSAVRLESVLADGDIFPGVIGLIDFEDDEAGGIPFTSSPDSVRMSLRYDIPMGDTAVVIFVFTKNGNPIGFSQNIILGNQNDFEEFTFDVPPILGVPDSLLFLASSSSLSNPDLGGYLEIDDIVFVGSNDQLPNNDFEIWESNEFENPDGWSSFNVFQTLFEFEPMVTETNDAAIGNSAVRIETVETIGFDSDLDEMDTIGFLTSGETFFNNPTFPLDNSPAQISGYYKYASAGNDSATVYLEFYKYNSVTQESEAFQEFVFYLPPTSDYTTFEFPLSITDVPDSVFIGFAAYDADIIDNVPLGNVLFLDELSWDLVNGTKLPILSNSLKVYPNPATDFIFIKTESVVGIPQSIEMTDVTGRTIRFSDIENLRVGEDLLKINVGDFATGMYYYTIITDEMSYAGKVMIKR